MNEYKLPVLAALTLLPPLNCLSESVARRIGLAPEIREDEVSNNHNGESRGAERTNRHAMTGFGIQQALERIRAASSNVIAATSQASRLSG
ncbi:hypothetical protein NE852_17000 [Rhizobium sp. Pop5]|uniref:hypothetical protein n=1 Tax=Rhizobium sp. Pop5 TaxID=1223565 RepID=UPI000283B365|nr:hypothetical protein [Rhizobium sp. Pop5]EJZ17235.1 hypothetical protein RCCGEPOP_31836 [Rhizobium sp. Pop5]UVD55779.1 hypothetical protein NE852_17000 [Rhizobium sp. Pop5]